MGKKSVGWGGGIVGGKSKTGKYVWHDTAKKTWTTERQKNGTTEESMRNDTAKKNVWKPKSKRGQPKKV